MKTLFSRLLALLLVVVVGLAGCSTPPPEGFTGNYQEDTLTVVETLRNAINLPDDSPERPSSQARARQVINDFSAFYRRNDSLDSLGSYTTMRTALNSLAGHYSSYPNRPVPEKMKQRLDQEFRQVEAALQRGA
ncbi:MAG: photosystem II protein Psb27 [Elainellaceae cyanobacterium]